MDSKVAVSSILAVISLIGAIIALYFERMYNDMAFSLSNQQMAFTIFIICVILTVIFSILAIYLNKKSK